VASLVYPFTFYRRAEIGLGYIYRKFDVQSFIIRDNQIIPVIVPITDNFPIVQASLVGDSAVYAQWGAVSGRRWRLDGAYAPQIQNGSGTLLTSLEVDARQYIPVSQRSNLALRLFAGEADGNEPNPFYFGGLDTVRGVDFRSLVGDRAFFANVEYRFPLVDLLATPVLGFQGIRGVAFFDIGGAYFKDFQDFKFFQEGTHHLQDAVASYGFGISTQLLGLDVNWDFSKRYDVDTSSGYKTSFWVGARF
jgi:hemolysin activation/secretion protein